MRRKELALLGYYGAGNLGDDLMMRGLLDELLASDPEVIVHVISYYRWPFAMPDSPRVRFVRAHSLLQKLVRLTPIFLRCRVACFGGGTAFTDTEGDGSYKFLRLAALLGCKIGYVGIGVGSLQRPVRRRRAAWLLSRCDFACFRDPESLRRARGLTNGVNEDRMSLSDDLVYLTLDSHAMKTRSAGPRSSRGHLIISWRELRSIEGIERDGLLAARFAELVARLCRAHQLTRISLLPLDNTMDLETHSRLYALLKPKVPDCDVALVRSETIQSALEWVAQADLYVSVRLHGAFIGKVMGVPTVGLTYSPKVAYYFDSIRSLSVVTWEALERDDDSLMNAVAVAIEEARTPVADLQSHVELARENIRVLMRALA